MADFHTYRAGVILQNVTYTSDIGSNESPIELRSCFKATQVEETIVEDIILADILFANTDCNVCY